MCACVCSQGKYINDPAVLLEAAKLAGVDQPEKVLQDVSVARDEVRKSSAMC